MKKSIFVISGIVLLVIIVLSCFVLEINYGTESVWENIVVHEYNTTTSRITLKKNGKLYFKKTQDDGTKMVYKLEGKWKKIKDGIEIVYTENNGHQSKYIFHEIDKDIMCADFFNNDCHESTYYYKKTLFSKTKEYIDKPEQNAIKQDDDHQWDSIETKEN